MQLLSKALKCASRTATAQLVSYNQASRLHRMTPICVHQNFLQNSFGWNERHRSTKSLTFSPHLRLQSFHTQNTQYFRNSNVLEFKRKTKTDDSDKSAKSAIAANNEMLSTGLDESQKLGLFQRFKKMAKDYWYVLIPVHVLTSACWLGAFYYTSTRWVHLTPSTDGMY